MKTENFFYFLLFLNNLTMICFIVALFRTSTLKKDFFVDTKTNGSKNTFGKTNDCMDFK